MPYKKLRKPNNKKRMIRRRKPTQNFKNRVLAIVNKNRELKRLYFTIDEEQVGPSGSKFLSFSYPSASGYSNSVVSNRVNRVSGEDYSYSRSGLELTPKYWEWKGVVKYQGFSTQAGYDEITVRIVLGFVDADNAPLADGDGGLQLSNGNSIALTADYAAIMRRFNWRKFRPIKDIKFKLQPATQNVNTGTNTTAFNSAPISKMLTLKHYFGRNPKNQVYQSVNNDYPNQGNLQMLIITRPTNDDTLITTNNVEVTGEGHFAYYDV